MTKLFIKTPIIIVLLARQSFGQENQDLVCRGQYLKFRFTQSEIE